jgi:hypothetical protein
MGVGMLGFVGGFSFYVALSSPPELHWLIFLLVVGSGALWQAVRMWQATEYRIELTMEGLRSTDGTIVALMDDIEDVDRSLFAFKPSNGFLIKLKSPGKAAWKPGLWWRRGRQIGVGGVTPVSEGKAMADILKALLSGFRPIE